VYGSALHALAERMSVPVTFATGLPVERTRPGRVAAAYFRWIEGGFDAGVVRTLLYAGDLTAPRPNDWIRGATLALRLRSLRIGWGRDRYLPAIDRALAEVDHLPARKYETPEKLERRRRQRCRELEALRDVLGPVLRHTPPVSMEAGPASTAVSPSRVARGLRRFLAHTSPGSSVDDTALERMTRTLERIEAALVRETDYRAAAAIVRRHLTFPVPAPRTEGSAPWSSAGGALYLTDIDNGGRTGRRATFVVGLDAHRMGSSATQDPYLLDSDRMRLAGSDLPRSTDRIRERRFRLAALLARLRGSICLSYAAWDPAEARAVSPSSELLQALRLMRGDPTATFKDLEAHVRERAGLVPRCAARLDATDVWMAALEKEGRLLEGEQMVRTAFPRIDAGLRARDALSGDRVTAHHGRIAPRPELDPRRNPQRSVSASALGTLGACGKRYFYGYVLGVRAPDDPEYDPETWLDPLRRGSVLHRVYERALNEARERGLEYHDPEFESLVIAILGEEVLRQARDIPAPSDVVRDRQEEELVRDAESFVAMIRDEPPSWIATELAFGFRGEEPVPFRSSSGPVMVRGAIDRLDRVPGGLRVVDYKTGGTYGFSPGNGVYNGGRRLQHVIYTAVASLRHDGLAAAMEYHFPTRKGENRSVPYSAEDLVGGAHLVSRLLDLVARGHFLPTDSADDCRYCDYKPVCRVREVRFSVVSPLADWVNERITDAPELQGLRVIRNWDEEGDGFLNALVADRHAPDDPGGVRP
jgi:ATP-dependent helicase/nuclease subunit B